MSNTITKNCIQVNIGSLFSWLQSYSYVKMSNTITKNSTKLKKPTMNPAMHNSIFLIPYQFNIASLSYTNLMRK